MAIDRKHFLGEVRTELELRGLLGRLLERVGERLPLQPRCGEVLGHSKKLVARERDALREVTDRGRELVPTLHALGHPLGEQVLRARCTRCRECPRGEVSNADDGRNTYRDECGRDRRDSYRAGDQGGLVAERGLQLVPPGRDAERLLTEGAEWTAELRETFRGFVCLARSRGFARFLDLFAESLFLVARLRRGALELVERDRFGVERSLRSIGRGLRLRLRCDHLVELRRRFLDARGIPRLERLRELPALRFDGHADSLDRLRGLVGRVLGVIVRRLSRLERVRGRLCRSRRALERSVKTIETIRGREHATRIRGDVDFKRRAHGSNLPMTFAVKNLGNHDRGRDRVDVGRVGGVDARESEKPEGERAGPLSRRRRAIDQPFFSASVFSVASSTARTPIAFNAPGASRSRAARPSAGG